MLQVLADLGPSELIEKTDHNYLLQVMGLGLATHQPHKGRMNADVSKVARPPIMVAVWRSDKEVPLARLLATGTHIESQKRTMNRWTHARQSISNLAWRVWRKCPAIRRHCEQIQGSLSATVFLHTRPLHGHRSLLQRFRCTSKTEE